MPKNHPPEAEEAASSKNLGAVMGFPILSHPTKGKWRPDRGRETSYPWLDLNMSAKQRDIAGTASVCQFYANVLAAEEKRN
jgi:hypothetical protein